MYMSYTFSPEIQFKKKVSPNYQLDPITNFTLLIYTKPHCLVCARKQNNNGCTHMSERTHAQRTHTHTLTPHSRVHTHIQQTQSFTYVHHCIYYNKYVCEHTYQHATWVARHLHMLELTARRGWLTASR